MAEFSDWFKRHEGVDPISCEWLRIFMYSLDPREVEQLFSQHQATLVAQEMVEELEGTLEIMKQRLPHPAAIVAMTQVRDRLALIEDARKFSAVEAVRRHRQKHQST